MGFNNTDSKLQRGEGAPPLYKQLKEIIRDEIAKGSLDSGEQIPTEYELCKKFSISRTPVRQALKELVNEGVLSRRQGSGTFVSEKPTQKITLSALITEKQWTDPLARATDRLNEKSNGPSIELDLEVLGRPHFHERILSHIGKGEAPDLALMDSAWVTEFAAYQFIKPLNEIDGDWTARIQEQLLEPFVNRNLYQGNLYALQPEANVSLLWYRKDEFDRLGLGPPHSWSELVEVAQRLKKAGWKFPLAFAGGTAAGETTTYQLLPLIWGGGGAILKDGKIGLKDGGVKAVEFLHDLVHRYEVAPVDVHEFSWNQPLCMFAEERVAMAFGGSYEKKRLHQYSGWNGEEFWKRVGWVALPGPKKGERYATAGGMVYALSRQAEHPKMAAKILREVMDKNAIINFCGKNDRVPTTRGAIEALDPRISRFSHQISALLSYAQAPPGLVQYANISEQLQLMFERVLLDQTSPAKSVKRASEVIAALS